MVGFGSDEIGPDTMAPPHPAHLRWAVGYSIQGLVGRKRFTHRRDENIPLAARSGGVEGLNRMLKGGAFQILLVAYSGARR